MFEEDSTASEYMLIVSNSTVSEDLLAGTKPTIAVVSIIVNCLAYIPFTASATI